ncbi:hypothetical protein AMS68_003059 [Peltaster fructicola]|uniref:NAD(P)-binding protein n=1 Tax=Peltaster fructicola TaxID=286661 RepID=A0A6H0XS02_9PEZI|nr:hypothetical protein AMS68_003059 [Peltaster fructicola]
MDILAKYTDIDTSRLMKGSHVLMRPLAMVGGLYVASQLYAVSSWTWLHLIRRGDLQKYKSKDKDTWAVVTGASAGIGKGFVQELASRGFNVILHGRNEGKLARFQNELQSQYPRLKFRLLILDAAEIDLSVMEAAIDEIKALNIRILINNVAGGGKHEKPILDSFQGKTAENIESWTSVTMRFPTHITRILLPTLIDKESSLILNIGSGVSEMAVPYLTVYAGLKSYNKVWSRSLQTELLADNNGHVEVKAIIVGRTATERGGREASLMIPTSRQMAKSSLESVGSSHSVVAPFWAHSLQDNIIGLFPQWFLNRFTFDIARKIMADERAGKPIQ